MRLRDCAFRISYGPGDNRLHEFYIPALQASIRYDRMTGYFTSSALAVAAAGVAHLIANGGQMRLLVGAQLAVEDVEAIRAGHDLREVVAARLDRALPGPETLADQMVRDRLAALAWMVAAGSGGAGPGADDGADAQSVFPRPRDDTPGLLALPGWARDGDHLRPGDLRRPPQHAATAHLWQSTAGGVTGTGAAGCGRRSLPPPAGERRHAVAPRGLLHARR